MSSTEATVKSFASLIREDSLSDLVDLAAAESVIGVPLARIVSGPRFAALVAVGTAEHVVLVKAVGSIAESNSLFSRLASEHGLRVATATRGVAWPAPSAVVATVADAKFVRCRLVNRV